jgi:hypothetical protein
VTHGSERDAALFVDGGMAPGARETFARHLLSCSACWREVDRARRGRSLVESARRSAPADLRERVRALVEAERLAEPAEPAGWLTRRRRRLAPLGVPAAAAVAVALVLVLGSGGTPDPPSLRQAVADFTAEQLPGAQLPDQRAPDLSALGLQPIGAGGGSYAGLEVDGYAYRDAAGRRVALYISDDPFPEAPGARQLAGNDGPWIAERGNVVVLCARLPHALLVVGQDDQLVLSTANALGVL